MVEPQKSLNGPPKAHNLLELPTMSLKALKKSLDGPRPRRDHAQKGPRPKRDFVHGHGLPKAHNLLELPIMNLKLKKV